MSPKTLPRQGCLIRNQEWEPAEILFGGNTIQLMTGAFKHSPCVFLSTHPSLSLASSYFMHLCFAFLCCFCRAWAGSVPRSLDSWSLPQCFPDSCCSINICWLTAWLFGCHGTLTFSRPAEATRSCRLRNRPPSRCISGFKRHWSTICKGAYVECTMKLKQKKAQAKSPLVALVAHWRSGRK